jgi:hypothetical protein
MKFISLFKTLTITYFQCLPEQIRFGTNLAFIRSVMICVTPGMRRKIRVSSEIFTANLTWIGFFI